MRRHDDGDDDEDGGDDDDKIKEVWTITKSGSEEKIVSGRKKKDRFKGRKQHK